MLQLLFVLAACALSVRATDAVAGYGSSSRTQDVKFSQWAWSDSLQTVSASTTGGANRSMSDSLPVDKMYGVNIGNWLIFEPWMAPAEWLSMGGEFCINGDCTLCRQSEWSLANYLGQEKTNEVFKKHWESWFTQSDVDAIKAAGLNSVRLPLGFWIIEDIVDKSHEPYAQGGLDELIRGLTMLQDAGLYATLDHHALPGVSSVSQMFAGNCTNDILFYDSPNDYNYKRAVTWAAVMTYLSHAHKAFGSVFSIEAVNEPEHDAYKTPGLDRYYQAFVLAVRSVESLMGITCDESLSDTVTDSIALPALIDAMPIIAKLSQTYQLGPFQSFDFNGTLREDGKITAGKMKDFLAGKDKCLSTQFMSKQWQGGQMAVDPSKYAHGPQVYDNHLYLNFGGVAPNDTEDSYMQTMCNLSRVADANATGNVPLVSGEWSLATSFNTTNDFLKKYGDAQKLAYAQGGGWTFWNFKVDQDAQTYPIKGDWLMWSYLDALKQGVVTQNPADVFDKDVCQPYLNYTAPPPNQNTTTIPDPPSTTMTSSSQNSTTQTTTQASTTGTATTTSLTTSTTSTGPTSTGPTSTGPTSTGPSSTSTSSSISSTSSTSTNSTSPT